jgi:RimJ/RimL family protein N-acetyltransferase
MSAPGIVVAPVTLEGARVRLEPLTLGHIDRLCEIGLDPQIWRFTTIRVADRAALSNYVETALKWLREGTAVPFVTIDRRSGEVVGTTRFANIVVEHRRAEIGWTWIAREWQRTHVNTEAKYLMLRHAFDVWSCVRIELKTSALNVRSRAAILRVGAVEEGILRRHMINADGSYRDSVYFSILNDEWPAVKRRLEERMNR